MVGKSLILHILLMFTPSLALYLTDFVEVEDRLVEHPQISWPNYRSLRYPSFFLDENPRNPASPTVDYVLNSAIWWWYFLQEKNFDIIYVWLPLLNVNINKYVHSLNSIIIFFLKKKWKRVRYIFSIDKKLPDLTIEDEVEYKRIRRNRAMFEMYLSILLILTLISSLIIWITLNILIVLLLD